VRALSTEPARFQSWLDVEAALAGRRPSWAFIPEAAGHDIDRKAHVKYLDRGDRGLTDGGGRTWHGHDRYAANLRRVHGWFRVWFGADDMAQALGARVMPLFAEDPLRIPDFIGPGPDAPRDEAARGVLRRRLG
jgi:hypothetical protein